MSDFIVIAHRGNISGPDPEQENKPEYLQAALDKGYDVEVDVWGSYQDNVWWAGHTELMQGQIIKDGE